MAGPDLCLRMIRRDHGSAVAADTARLSVMPLESEGGQAQFIVHDQPVGSVPREPVPGVYHRWCAAVPGSFPALRIPLTTAGPVRRCAPAGRRGR